MQPRLTVLLPCLALLIVLPACREDCDPQTFESHCQGNVARNCPEPGPDQFFGIGVSNHDCEDQVCVMSEYGAMCALSSEPDPACSNLPESRSYLCDSSTTQLYCSNGYATTRRECLRCESDDAGYPNCIGGLGGKCSSNAECIPSLVCVERGSCGNPPSESEG